MIEYGAQGRWSPKKCAQRIKELALAGAVPNVRQARHNAMESQ